MMQMQLGLGHPGYGLADQITPGNPFTAVGPDVSFPLGPNTPSTPAIPMWYRVLATLSAAISGYHGYKRNNSIGWGIGWFLLGGLFPVITPTVAFAQGLGKRKAGR